MNEFFLVEQEIILKIVEENPIGGLNEYTVYWLLIAIPQV